MFPTPTALHPEDTHADQAHVAHRPAGNRSGGSSGWPSFQPDALGDELMMMWRLVFPGFHGFPGHPRFATNLWVSEFRVGRKLNGKSRNTQGNELAIRQALATLHGFSCANYCYKKTYACHTTDNSARRRCRILIYSSSFVVVTYCNITTCVMGDEGFEPPTSCV
jgi:hypothetical protein